MNMQLFIMFPHISPTSINADFEGNQSILTLALKVASILPM